MIVVTAPTSAIGRQVIDKLLAAGESVRVIARDPAKLAPHVRDRVEVVQGSHGAAEVVNEAFKGADAVFWLPPPDAKATIVEAVFTDFSKPACAAFKTAGVERVVGISALGRGTAVADKAGLVTASLAMDDLIAKSGVSYRALTMPSFMDNLLRQAGSIKEKAMFFSPIAGDQKSPTCSTGDIAAAAAKLLIDTSWSGNGHVAVLGPEDLSFDDMAQIMSEVLGKKVTFQQIPGETFKARLLSFGSTEAMAQATLDMMTAKNNGLDNAEPRTAQSSSPTSFRQWCEAVLKPAVMA
ncbi:MAG: NAD(P)H-binding protein [Pseudolabrys sp.]|nr:NAD(P)H-binding protein [Pseudolabrys sp.]